LIQKVLMITTWVVYRLSPARPWPERPLWTVNFGGEDTVYALFFRQESYNKYTGYHAMCIVSTPSGDMLVDDVARQLVAHPLPCATSFIKEVQPDYTVIVRTDTKHKDGRYVPEIYSCAAVVKKILGVNAPWIFTTEQLMGALWEVRYE